MLDRIDYLLKRYLSKLCSRALFDKSDNYFEGGGGVFPYFRRKRNNLCRSKVLNGRGPHSFERSPLLLYSKLEIGRTGLP